MISILIITFCFLISHAYKIQNVLIITLLTFHLRALVFLINDRSHIDHKNDFEKLSAYRSGIHKMRSKQYFTI